MKARIVYESIFGNTMAIAEAIARGLSVAFDFETVEVAASPPNTSGVDLIVVGGPTHVLAISRPSTRSAGKQQAAKISVRRSRRASTSESGSMAWTKVMEPWRQLSIPAWADWESSLPVPPPREKPLS